MPSKSLSKVSKHISKKKGAKINSLHENSRDSQRLRRASARDDKINRLSSARAKMNRPFVQRAKYFQTAAAEKGEGEVFTNEEIHALIAEYLLRDAAELSLLQSSRRAGRPAAMRDDQLTAKLALEEKEYVSGFWMPDVQDSMNLALLRNWSGEWVSLSTMKFVRMSRDGTRHESSFPPKGMS
ncbi:translation machinery-associated protein 16 [Cryomyces antarcticus]|nr:hypothetical protein LTR04_005815 [Oleoguttula sp. CCFEE 6159]